MPPSLNSDAFSHRCNSLQPSLIRELAEAGMRLPDAIPLWFGESAWPTSDSAVQAAVSALQQGDHFYQPNSGRPTLREAIAAYVTRMSSSEIGLSRVTVTASGMQAVALVAQALTDPGDRVITIEPGWPNLPEAFRIAGASVDTHPLGVRDGVWHLDLDALLADIDERTRVLVINSPSNPTGWVMPPDDQQRLLEHLRRTGTWLVADEVYQRLYRHGDMAPSPLSLSTDNDRVISVNSFSKAWSMTGWRLGWIVAPQALEERFAMLTEANIAGPPGFIQAAGEHMIRNGESVIATLRERLDAAYALSVEHLQQMSRVEFIQPDGAFYHFVRVHDLDDSVALARQLLTEAGVGVAPGRAFGAAGEGCLRLCYAQPVDVIERAMERLGAALG